jgi:hypothetical protein
MDYGDKKIKTMVRSILPAKRRGARRARVDKRIAHKADRAAYRNIMSTLDLTDLDLDDTIDIHDGSRGPFRFELRSVVRDRRDSDKVGPFMRWAERTMQDTRQEDRTSKIRALLPDSVIGQHAAGHIRGMDAFADPRDMSYSRRGYHSTYKPAVTAEDRRDFLYKACARPALHRALNAYIKSCFPRVPVINKVQHVSCGCDPVQVHQSFYKGYPVRGSDPYKCPNKIIKYVDTPGTAVHPEARHFLGISDVDAYLNLLGRFFLSNQLDTLILNYKNSGYDDYARERLYYR